METYSITHLDPRGQQKAVLSADSAYTPAFSLRLTGDGDCRNGVVNQFARLSGVRVGDVLGITLDDGHGTPVHYAGEVRVGASDWHDHSADLNLAGLMARLGKVDVRTGRVPDAGQADPARIARTAVEASAAQVGTLLLTDQSGMPDSNAEPTALLPHYAPLSSVLHGLAGRIPGGVAGVDGQRRVFCRARVPGVIEVDATEPGVELVARTVSGEGLCTAVRWMLGVGTDGHPITYLSRSPLADSWGEHTSQVSVNDGLLYLKRLPHDQLTLSVRQATITTYRGGTPDAAPDLNVLGDGDPGSRAVLTGTNADFPPELTAVPPSGRRVDVARISATANTPRVFAYNDFEGIGHRATGQSGLNGMYLAWTQANRVGLGAGGRALDSTGAVLYPVLDIATLELYEIDRAALDRLATTLYRVPSSNPVDVHVHGRWLPPQPHVQVTGLEDGTLEAAVGEMEYVSRPGWWGTIIHVEQARDGAALAQAEAIANRDAETRNDSQRAQLAGTAAARGVQ